MRRILILLKNLISMPYRALFTKISIFAGLQNSKVDRQAAICKGTRFYRSEIGRYSYIGNDTFVTNTHIGNFTSISSNCYIGGANHPTDWVSTSPVFHRWGNILHKNFAKFEFDIFAETYIGNDVWIGEGCKIRAGIHISDGAIIGTGSVLTHDVGAYEVWAGNPARCIRKRFDDTTIEGLLDSKWWELNDVELSALAPYFNNPQLFMDKVPVKGKAEQ